MAKPRRVHIIVDFHFTNKKGHKEADTEKVFDAIRGALEGTKVVIDDMRMKRTIG